MPDVAKYWTGLARAGAVEARRRFTGRLPEADLAAMDAMAELVHGRHLLPTGCPRCRTAIRGWTTCCSKRSTARFARC